MDWLTIERSGDIRYARSDIFGGLAMESASGKCRPLFPGNNTHASNFMNSFYSSQFACDNMSDAILISLNPTRYFPYDIDADVFCMATESVEKNRDPIRSAVAEAAILKKVMGNTWDYLLFRSALMSRIKTYKRRVK